jgi:trans-L-3-hydroxyproline dehydratase
MCGALLTEPVSPAAHAGLLFMDNGGFGWMSGHGIIAATAIALDRGLLMPGGDGLTIVYDTPAGTIRARTHTGVSAGRVSFVNVPSFVLFGGLPIRLENRQIRVDVAFGGAFYVIVDSEAAGLGIDAAHLPDIRRVGMEIARAVDRAHRIEHPLEPRLAGVEGTIFTGPASDGRADLRSVTVFANAGVDRSPSGTAMSAVMAVLKEMSLLSENATFVNEGLIGTLFSGRVTGRTIAGEHEAILPEIDGAAFITGEHTFFVDDDDPYPEGFLL